jgi:hypothetical protein
MGSSGAGSIPAGSLFKRRGASPPPRLSRNPHLHASVPAATWTVKRDAFLNGLVGVINAIETPIRVAKAHEAVRELSSFLKDAKHAAFSSMLEQEHEFPINLSNKEFWGSFCAFTSVWLRLVSTQGITHLIVNSPFEEGRVSSVVCQVSSFRSRVPGPQVTGQRQQATGRLPWSPSPYVSSPEAGTATPVAIDSTDDGRYLDPGTTAFHPRCGL